MRSLKIGKYISVKFEFINWFFIMRYLEKYIEEKMRIKILGELTTRECAEGDNIGVSLVIDGYEPVIEVWYVDYVIWLEEKLSKSCYKNLFSDSDYKNMFSGCEK